MDPQTKKILVIFGFMALAAWFLLGERKTFWEKILVVFIVVFIYVSYMLMSGKTMDQILGPLMVR